VAGGELLEQAAGINAEASAAIRRLDTGGA